jgi:hypothetical protein
MFSAPRKPKTTVFTMFSRYLQCFLGSRLAKALVFTQFSACCEKHSWQAPKKTANICQKVPKMDLQKASLFYFFPTPDPEKRENITGVKDFGGSAISLIFTFYI